LRRIETGGDLNFGICGLEEREGEGREEEEGQREEVASFVLSSLRRFKLVQFARYSVTEPSHIHSRRKI